MPVFGGEGTVLGEVVVFKFCFFFFFLSRVAVLGNPAGQVSYPWLNELISKAISACNSMSHIQLCGKAIILVAPKYQVLVPSVNGLSKML